MEKFKLSEGNSIILDLIRGLSAQVVVIGHGISFFGIFIFLHQPNFPWMQNIAVLIFFLLSGFLITYSTMRKENYSFTHYFIDRFSRIYSAFIPAIFFVLLIDLISKNIKPFTYDYSAAFNIKTFICNLFMLQDYPLFYLSPDNFVTSFGSARTFWTLAVEWWIYMCFGYLILVVFRKNKLDIKTLIILGFLSIVSIFNVINNRGNGLTIYWIFGAIIYLLISQGILGKLKLNIKIVLLIALLSIAILRISLTMKEYEPIFAFILATMLLLIIDISSKIKFSAITIKLIKLNASYSYTLFLIHYSILAFLYDHFLKTFNPYILFIFGFLISNVISIIIGYYSETILTKKVKIFLLRFFKINQDSGITVQVTNDLNTHILEPRELK